MTKIKLFFNPESTRIFARELRRVSWVLLFALIAGGTDILYNGAWVAAGAEWLILQLLALFAESIQEEDEA